jgi:hypothetical protein
MSGQKQLKIAKIASLHYQDGLMSHHKCKLGSIRTKLIKRFELGFAL